MHDIELILHDYRLTTAEIFYHFPDHPSLLQSFIWQELDFAPRYPKLQGFLDFWEHNIEGKLHSVNIAGSERLNLGEWRFSKAEYTLN